MKKKRRFYAIMAGTAAAFFLIDVATADPWVGVGDDGLRSDILFLSSAGVIEDVTMQWPLPWSTIASALERPHDETSPAVRAAIERVRAHAMTQLQTQPPTLAATIDVTSEPALIRGFDAGAISPGQGQISIAEQWSTTAVRLSLGAKTAYGKDRQVFMADGSYLTQSLGPVRFYAGYLTHWWGPGWISALSLSNNARPMPQIGLTRTGTDAFETPWLSWLGRWQAEVFVGLLDGPRQAENTVYTAVRFAFHPISHLEIGLARTTEMCGTGHSCRPLIDYFSITNDPKHTNNTNDQGNIDIRYSDTVSGLPFETYVQFMNEDTNPLQHSGTSHLFGSSLWLPVGDQSLRLTAEYTDSVATHDLWGSGTMPGFSYNNWRYHDGMRYRGRSLGYSLDSDSRLLSLQASLTAPQGTTYTVGYHHAEISSPQNLARQARTATPVVINVLEGKVRLPLVSRDGTLTLDMTGRLQDKQLSPRHGGQAALEAALTAHL